MSKYWTDTTIINIILLYTLRHWHSRDVGYLHVLLYYNSRYGVALVGVRPAELPEFYEDTILLNPGPRHIMKKSDTCYYMSITKEENSAFVVNQQHINNNVSSEPVIVTSDDKDGATKTTTTTTTTTTTVPTTGNNKADGTGPPQIILQVPTCVSECCVVHGCFCRNLIHRHYRSYCESISSIWCKSLLICWTEWSNSNYRVRVLRYWKHWKVRNFLFSCSTRKFFR